MSAASEAETIDAFRRGYEERRRLVGRRCEACGFRTATWALLCPRCGARALREAPLSGRGRVVAGTVQTVPADEFVNDAPYAYVVVDLDEGGRVTGWMPVVRTPDALRLGRRVRWTPSYRPGLVFEWDDDPSGERPETP
jgi:uncharacterized OB-fold protein